MKFISPHSNTFGKYCFFPFPDSNFWRKAILFLDFGGRFFWDTRYMFHFQRRFRTGFDQFLGRLETLNSNEVVFITFVSLNFIMLNCSNLWIKTLPFYIPSPFLDWRPGGWLENNRMLNDDNNLWLSLSLVWVWYVFELGIIRVTSKILVDSSKA